MNYKELVEQYKDDLIQDLSGLLAIDSVRGEKTPEAPVGKGPLEALNYMMALGDRDGMTTKSVENLAGHIEYGSGEEIFGVLGHVDVVPVSDDWDTPPFEPTIKDGYLIARGVQDDKGPTMAAYYAMKILKEQGYEFNKRLRLIIGTDEESNWECTEAYFKHEAMPDAGFAPDAAFPLIHGEKGISTFDLIQEFNEENTSVGSVNLVQFNSGSAYNVVPDVATAILKADDEVIVIEAFEKFLADNNVEGTVESTGDLTLKAFGKNAHGSTPDLGVHAGHILLKFLNQLDLDGKGSHFVTVMNSYIVDNLDGKQMDLFSSHEEMGETTVNSGIIKYDMTKGAVVGVNYRYPFGVDFDKNIEALTKTITAEQFSIKDASGQPPHYVNADDPLIKVLVESYRNHVEDDRAPFTIGGGTYARTLDKGVAFGAMFKDTLDTMHQKNERMKIDELILVTTIYLEALHRIVTGNEI